MEYKELFKKYQAFFKKMDLGPGIRSSENDGAEKILTTFEDFQSYTRKQKGSNRCRKCILVVCCTVLIIYTLGGRNARIQSTFNL